MSRIRFGCVPAVKRGTSLSLSLSLSFSLSLSLSIYIYIYICIYLSISRSLARSLAVGLSWRAHLAVLDVVENVELVRNALAVKQAHHLCVCVCVQIHTTLQANTHNLARNTLAC